MSMEKRSLGLVFFPAFDWAISPTHPEREERLLFTRDQVVEEGILDLPQIREYRPRMAEIRDLERVHIGVPDIADLITDAHRVSAGGAITAAAAVMRGEVERSFALVRPPGHHAMKVVHGTRGFCTVNIEAVMVEYLRRHYGIRQVAIVDTDVHHGDGTQDIYYHDPDTLFISFHQNGRTLYPGSGFTNEMGSPGALLSTINIPLPPGTGDDGIHAVLDDFVLPVLADFKPEIIINSAGQDNHYSDPLANMAVTAQGYARLTEKLRADVAVLEGGYSIEDALPYVNVGIILAMAGMDYSRVIEPNIDEAPMQSASTTRYIGELVRQWRQTWADRDRLKTEAIASTGGSWTRERSVYYDDSQIMERQQETLHYCRHCKGYQTISSESSGSYSFKKSAFAAVLGLEACPDCRRNGKESLIRAKQAGQHQYYILQDRQEDTTEKI